MFLMAKDYFIKIKNIKISVASAISYICDWIIYALLVTLFSLYRTCYAPRYHEFALDDNRYAHTFFNSREVLLTNTILFTISLVAPILYILIQFSLPKKQTKVRKMWNIHCALLGFLAAQTLQAVIVSILKNGIGAPRPDMIRRCMPRSYNLAPIGYLSNVGICANIHVDVINDGFRSFPSGHASTSFCSSTYVFFIFATRNNIFEKRHPSYKMVLGVLPLIISLFVTATRFSDNRHFLLDLFVGAKIGVLSAYCGYHLYFPHFKSCGCRKGNAFPPRRISFGKKKSKFLFWRLPKDKEYRYDSDAISVDDDPSILPYNCSDDEASLGSKPSSRKCKRKVDWTIGRRSHEQSEKNDENEGEVHDHSHQSTNRSHKSQITRPRTARSTTQTTTYTIQMKDPEKELNRKEPQL